MAKGVGWYTGSFFLFSRGVVSFRSNTVNKTKVSPGAEHPGLVPNRLFSKLLKFVETNVSGQQRRFELQKCAQQFVRMHK